MMIRRHFMPCARWVSPFVKMAGRKHGFEGLSGTIINTVRSFYNLSLLVVTTAVTD